MNIRVRHNWVSAPLGRINVDIKHVYLELLPHNSEDWEIVHGTATDGQFHRVKEWLIALRSPEVVVEVLEEYRQFCEEELNAY